MWNRESQRFQDFVTDFCRKNGFELAADIVEQADEKFFLTSSPYQLSKLMFQDNQLAGVMLYRAINPTSVSFFLKCFVVCTDRPECNLQDGDDDSLDVSRWSQQKVSLVLTQLAQKQSLLLKEKAFFF